MIPPADCALCAIRPGGESLIRDNMKTLKKICCVAFLLLLAAAGFTGCRTAHGFGEDMEHAGQKLQNKTD